MDEQEGVGDPPEVLRVPPVIARPRTQTEAALIRVIELVATVWPEIAQEARRVADHNAEQGEGFEYIRGVADGYDDAARQIRDEIGLAVWTRYRRGA